MVNTPKKISVTIPATTSRLKLLSDVDTTNIQDGALLQYRESDAKFVARTNIDTETGTLVFNGGNF